MRLRKKLLKILQDKIQFHYHAFLSSPQYKIIARSLQVKVMFKSQNDTETLKQKLFQFPFISVPRPSPGRI